MSDESRKTDDGANAPETADAAHVAEALPNESDAAVRDVSNLAAQRDEYFEQLQRTRAEFLNYQKRARTQADLDRQYAIANVATDLLGVLDNLERATEAARTAGGAESIVNGLDMVIKQFLDTLARHGVEPIEAMGLPFDPHSHEALMQQPDARHPEGTVVAEMSRGYKIKDRVLRPSKVAVSVKPS